MFKKATKFQILLTFCFKIKAWTEKRLLFNKELLIKSGQDAFSGIHHKFFNTLKRRQIFTTCFLLILGFWIDLQYHNIMQNNWSPPGNFYLLMVFEYSAICFMVFTSTLFMVWCFRLKRFLLFCSLHSCTYYYMKDGIVEIWQALVCKNMIWFFFNQGSHSWWAYS